MATPENLSRLVEELRGSRERLQGLADRAATAQRRLQTDATTIVSLDKLTHERRPMVRPPEGERFEGEEGHLGSDAWEISLINEEG